MNDETILLKVEKKYTNILMMWKMFHNKKVKISPHINLNTPIGIVQNGAFPLQNR